MGLWAQALVPGALLCWSLQEAPSWGSWERTPEGPREAVSPKSALTPLVQPLESRLPRLRTGAEDTGAGWGRVTEAAGWDRLPPPRSAPPSPCRLLLAYARFGA